MTRYTTTWSRKKASNPVDLRKLQSEREKQKDTYTIGKIQGSTIGLVATTLEEESPGKPKRSHIQRADEVIQTLQNVSDFIPPFRAVFTPHDFAQIPVNRLAA